MGERNTGGGGSRGRRITPVGSHDAVTVDGIRSRGRGSGLGPGPLLVLQSLAGRIAVAVIVGKSRAAHRRRRGPSQSIGGAGNGAGSGTKRAADNRADGTARVAAPCAAPACSPDIAPDTGFDGYAGAGAGTATGRQAP